MKKLGEILKHTTYKEIKGGLNICINNLSLSSLEVQPGSLFIAQKGAKSDGHNYIPQAIEKGAVAIACEHYPSDIKGHITYILIPDTHIFAGDFSAAFHDFPSHKMKIVGVTGTNGKTTIVYLLFNLFRSLNYKVGLISTVRNQINDRKIPSKHTTPDAITVQTLLSDMSKEGCEYVFMEVSSHAVVQKRIVGIDYSVAVFTNISHDHLDYHQTFSNYIKAKKIFFDNQGKHVFSVINADDKNADIMVQNTKSKVIRYGIRANADVRAKILETALEGTLMNIDGKECWIGLPGYFNAYNVLASYCVATCLGIDSDTVLQHLTKSKPVEGRFEIMKSREGTIGVVDYAHTPDAVKNILEAINKIKSAQSKLITVMGCGGDRDKEKRPVMAKVGMYMSDMLILTSDNPRTEDPMAIIEDMKTGLTKQACRDALIIVDRAEAIKTAVKLAGEKDIIAVLGKGHENYQEVNHKRHFFDDKKVLAEAMYSA